MNFKRILVVTAADQLAQPALERALYLAQKLSARVTAFLSIYDFSYEMTTMLAADERDAMRESLLQDRRAWLQDILDKLAEHELYRAVQVELEVVWHNRPFESIIKTSLQGEYDLIIKATRQHDTLPSLIFTPTDWHLLRKAPAPVLMVKSHAWQQRGKILAAVHAAAEDDAHRSLNRRIIEHAQQLARAVQADVHLVNAFPPAPMTVAMEIPEFDLRDYSGTVRANHERALQTLAAEYQLAADHVHVEEGLPEYVIPELAERLDAELVVLGTIGRSGISAALLGNTAEHVLDQLECDVLAIKPEGFTSPVKL